MYSYEQDSLTCLQTKKDSLLFRGQSPSGPLFVKALSARRRDLIHALRDEYAVLKEVRRPFIPAYYEYIHDLQWNGKCYEAITMEYIDNPTLSVLLPCLSSRALFAILARVGRALDDLRLSGIVYTDLNPGNILLNGKGDFTIVDYTGAWFYLRNPHPDYSLRFSYRLTFEGNATALLIRELALMLNEIIEIRNGAEGHNGQDSQKKEGSALPSSVYPVLETGLHPSNGLTLDEYAGMLYSLSLS